VANSSPPISDTPVDVDDAAARQHHVEQEIVVAGDVHMSRHIPEEEAQLSNVSPEVVPAPRAPDVASQLLPIPVTADNPPSTSTEPTSTSDVDVDGLQQRLKLVEQRFSGRLDRPLSSVGAL
jgi:hypothetical protein